jgi:ATP-binding protein involved in chromosome partitioning
MQPADHAPPAPGHAGSRAAEDPRTSPARHMDGEGAPPLSPVATDHARHPRNPGPLEEADGHARLTGPCGDTMEVWLQVEGDRVARAAFRTSGCGSSRACGSMVTCLARGRTVQEASWIDPDEILGALGGLPSESEHCALLATRTLQGACEDHLRRPAAATQEPGGGAPPSAPAPGKTSPPPPVADHTARELEQRRRLEARLSRIRSRVIVLSGKGGVGKSTVAVNLALALASSGQRVGLLDVDVHGPSVPTLLGLRGQVLTEVEDGLSPVKAGDLAVVSLGFLLYSQDAAVIWRGPRKMGLIRQFLAEVVWGDLDVLVIDSPPGTGDEPLSVCELLGEVDGAVIVTTPQRVATTDVRRSVTFCRVLGVPVLGVVENMSGFACPRCGEVTPIFRTGGGQRIAEDMGIPFLGAIPMDPLVAASCDEGRPFLDEHAASPTARVMLEILGKVQAAVDDRSHS